jgi:hypothetical protein
MKINIIGVAYQIYVTPYIKITHSKFLNGDREFIIGWLKWELVISF